LTATTEVEIFDCLINNLKSAASDCESLARLPAKGPTFQRLVESLALAEGAAQQMCFWRDGDTRWLNFMRAFETAHQMVRKWIVDRAPPEPYLRVAVQIRLWLKMVEILRDQRTERKSGPILPEAGEATEVRQGRPVQVKTPEAPVMVNGLIIPDGVKVQ
jgi:hypothetical protein